MCRLYGFRATHPTKAECELIESQNSLLRQSERDERGLGNPAGWGIGVVRDGRVTCERQVKPAFESDEYRRDAANSEGTTVLGHVRRATVGEPRLENTHPFRRGQSLLVHNGHIPAFDRVRPRLLEEIRPGLRESIEGDTDSEHVFCLLLSRLRERRPGGDGGPAGPDPELMRDVLADAVREIRGWCEAAVGSGGDVPRGPEGHRLDRVALNLLWSVGDRLVGSRIGRSLWYVERDERHRCTVCGEFHPPGPEPEGYESVVVASERVTREDWREVPEGSVFYVDEALDLRIASVRDRARPAVRSPREGPGETT